MKTTLSIALALVLLGALQAYAKDSPSKLQVRTLTILTLTPHMEEGNTEGPRSVSLEAEMAYTDKEKARGYMERTHIPLGTGMLFIYTKDIIMHFWMKDTPTPLSIAFIDSKGSIRDIFDMVPYSTIDVASTGYNRYALEVPKGWFTKVGVHVGDRLVLDF